MRMFLDFVLNNPIIIGSIVALIIGLLIEYKVLDEKRFKELLEIIERVYIQVMPLIVAANKNDTHSAAAAVLTIADQTELNMYDAQNLINQRGRTGTITIDKKGLAEAILRKHVLNEGNVNKYSRKMRKWFGQL